MNTISAAITAVGGYVPEYVLTNQILETMVDTNDEWITTRTGIKERRILKEEGKGSSYLAIKAAKDLLEKSNLDPKDIDMLIMATATPDMPVAISGAYVATEIGAINAFSYDLMILWLPVQVFFSECLLQQSILNLAEIKKFC